MGKIAN